MARPYCVVHGRNSGREWAHLRVSDPADPGRSAMMRRTAILLIWAMSAAATTGRAQCPPAGTDWCSGTYGYDAMGNIRSIGQDVYEYDTAGRLVSGTADVQRSGVMSRQRYGYDAFGNRTSATRDGGSLSCIGGCELP